MEFTSKTYWEDYYSKSSIETNLVKKICSEYDEYYDMMISSCSIKPKSIIEIGAYPGRYIAYLANKYQLHPTALDYNSDTKKIESAFHAFNIQDFDIIQADFLKFKSEKKYDLIFSNGFIEHFENYDEVLDKHADLLSEGGSVMIMIPNKRYLRKLYGLLVDYGNLKAHNLKCMDLNTFKKFAERNNLSINHLAYHGGFAFRVHQPLNIFQKVIYHTAKKLSKVLNPILEKSPNRLWSGTIVAILTKPKS